MVEGEEAAEAEGSYYAECIHALVGHRNRSYPIRSALHVGSEYTNRPGSARRSAVVDTYSGADDARVVGGRYKVGSDATQAAMPTVHSTVLLATGSADGDACVYDVGGPNGTGELVQKLRGHSDRVYDVAFHPREPILATGSADFSVRLWAPQLRNRGRKREDR